MTKIAGIIHNSVVDGPGLRTTIFFSGCRRKCPGCHNPEAQSFDYGREISEADAGKLIEEVINSGDAGITLSGGHPLEPENYKMAEAIIDQAKAKNLNIWLYTGYIFEQIPLMYMDLIGDCNVVVDGPFVEALKSGECLYRGSTNQRIIDIQKTMEQGEVILWNK